MKRRANSNANTNARAPKAAKTLMSQWLNLHARLRLATTPAQQLQIIRRMRNIEHALKRTVT